MTEYNLDQEKAARIFVDMLARIAYDGTVKDMKDVLETGPRQRVPPPRDKALHAWFQTLDDESKRSALDLVQEAVRSCLFYALVLLDGSTGGYPIPGVLSEFALYLQIHENLEAEKKGKAQFSVRIDGASATEDLRDLFLEALDDRSSNSEEGGSF